MLALALPGGLPGSNLMFTLAGVYTQYKAKATIFFRNRGGESLFRRQESHYRVSVVVRVHVLEPVPRALELGEGRAGYPGQQDAGVGVRRRDIQGASRHEHRPAYRRQQVVHAGPVLVGLVLGLNVLDAGQLPRPGELLRVVRVGFHVPAGVEGCEQPLRRDVHVLEALQDVFVLRRIYLLRPAAIAGVADELDHRVRVVHHQAERDVAADGPSEDVGLSVTERADKPGGVIGELVYRERRGACRCLTHAPVVEDDHLVLGGKRLEELGAPGVHRGAVAGDQYQGAAGAELLVGDVDISDRNHGDGLGVVIGVLDQLAHRSRRLLDVAARS